MSKIKLFLSAMLLLSFHAFSMDMHDSQSQELLNKMINFAGENSSDIKGLLDIYVSDYESGDFSMGYKAHNNLVSLQDIIHRISMTIENGQMLIVDEDLDLLQKFANAEREDNRDINGVIRYLASKHSIHIDFSAWSSRLSG